MQIIFEIAKLINSDATKVEDSRLKTLMHNKEIKMKVTKFNSDAT